MQTNHDLNVEVHATAEGSVAASEREGSIGYTRKPHIESVTSSDNVLIHTHR